MANTALVNKIMAIEQSMLFLASRPAPLCMYFVLNPLLWLIFQWFAAKLY
jgi:hypothetical protein